MNLKFKIVCAILLLFSFQSTAQSDLYIPRNVQKAFNIGTRSYDGKPGTIYWQNSSDYNIKVNIDLENHLLIGSEKITYYNNSPDTLKTIVIRLYQNIMKKGAMRDFTIPDPDAVNDGVKIIKIKIDNDVPEDNAVSVNSTLMTIKLSNYIEPKSETNLEFEWSFPLQDKVQIRMGGYDSTSYLIGYWYPQISVFDDIDGWDTYPYAGIREFYNDFNNYSVEITVPKNFNIWATGELQNAKEIYSEEYYNRFQSAQKSDSVIRIVSEVDLNAKNIFKNDSKNIFKYKAENVTDFVFSFSDHYLWDGVSLVVDKLSGRRVFIDAAYKKESTDFLGVAKIARETIEYLSFKMPAVPFPFPCFTVFNGSGGMEFPMMINDGSTETLESTIQLTSHETSHQYFPFYMGTNEQKYAFMDEGWAVFLPLRFQQKYYKNNFPRIREIKNYENFAGNETEMPLMIPSVSLDYRSYRNSAYVRSSLAYRFLDDFLGDSLFLNALSKFINDWHGKHPIPYDFFFTFNRIVGKDLSWYWKPWFFEPGYPDLKLSKAYVKDYTLKIAVEKIGNIPVPVAIKIINFDGSQESIYYNASVWEKSNELQINYNISRPVKEIELGREDIPDVNRSNNKIVIQ